MNAKLKSGLKFLFCTSAFSQRNVTSIGLVIAFIVVYVLAGGKVTTSLPQMSKSGQFGLPAKSAKSASSSKSNFASEESRNLIPDLSEKESKSILGEIPSQNRKIRSKRRAKFGKLFTEEERLEAESEEIDPAGLVEGADFTNDREKWMLERSEKKPVDSLSKIEERLRIKKRR